MEILKVENLNFTYAGSHKPVLDGVSFSVNSGEFVTVCGATGSGKSTLLRMIKRELTPEGEKSGNITVCGALQGDLSPREAAEKIGFVFQHPEQQIVCDKVWHELAFGLENLGVPPETVRRRVAETACFFGLEDIFYKKTAELSGGQKQLVALASVTAMRPEILLLDEPTSRLDPVAAADFISMLKRLVRETGITVLIVEHSLGELLSATDKLLVLDGGRVAGFDTPGRVISSLPERSEIIKTLPSAPKIFLSLGAPGECPLDVSEGRDFLTRNYKNDVRSLPRKDAAPHGECAVEIKNVFFRYSKTEKDALAGLTLNVYKGEVFAILGGNGSGKTTALCVAAGLYRPFSGTVRIFGKDIREYRNQTLYNNCLSMLFQDVQTVFLKNTVREELESVGKTDIGLPFDITHLYGSHPYDLSGGEQQLVALGKVLLTKPRLLLLDEPTKALDGGQKEKLAGVIKGLKEDGVTVVIVTHDTDFAAMIADRCALFFAGEAISAGEPRDFFSDNGYYTTGASRISRVMFDGAVTESDVVTLCRLNGRRE